MTISYGSYCFDVEAFAAEEFDLGVFLEECRARNPMETIHQDLKQFQTALENQVRRCRDDVEPPGVVGDAGRMR